MAILPRPAPYGFSTPRKGGGARMGLVFLSSTRPPHPALIRTIILNLVNPISLIFKVKHKSTRHEIKYFLF